MIKAMQNNALTAVMIFHAVFFALDLYIFSKTTRNIVRKSEYRFFIALIVIHLIYLVMSSLWTLQEFESIHLSQTVMKAVCASSFSCITLCSFIFFIFTVVNIDFSPARKRRFRILCVIPEAVILMLILSSPWTGYIFSLDAESRLNHGPMYTFMLISSSLYLIAVICIAGYHMFTAKTLARRKSSGALLLSVGVIIAFVIIDDMLDKATVLPVSVFAVILVIFINLLESNINNDALTGMNNRRKADEYLMDQLANVSDEHPLYLYMCDMNSFKSINDIYGHTEGDEALRICGNMLKRTIARYNGFAARFGGDEFILIWQPDQKADPEMLAEDIQCSLEEQSRELNKPYSLTISVGYAVCTSKRESLPSCIRRADEMLYKQKEAFYRRGK